jgi:hypothetical protein|tara:strand:+ start:1561 stop:2919 length:1359 start_codon:yes stop_codon:yes gene_type:complete
MKTINRLLLVILMSFFTFGLNAEEPGLDVNQNDVAQFAPSPGDAARDWLDERCSSGKRCLVEGYNDPEEEGQSTVYVAIGTGYSSMPNSSQQIHSARQNAYSKAMLNAKAEFVRALGSQISVSMQNINSENTMPDVDPTAIVDEAVKKTTGAITDMSEFEKIKKLINLKLNDQLKKNGYDENAEVEKKKEIIKKVLNSDVFESTMQQSAQAFLSGFQTWKTFEKGNPGDRNEITIVGIWSDKLAELASHIKNYNPQTFPLKEGKTKTLKEQLPLDNADVIRRTFGARMYYNERGEMSVVAFGHQAPQKEGNDRLFSNACKKARNQATAQLTLFVNESVYYNDNFVEKDAQGTQVVNGQEEEFAFLGQDWEETIKATGALKDAKFARIAQKKVPADKTFGASDCIVVVSWSPDNERGAKAVENANQSTSTNSTKSEKNNSSDSGEGAAGDSDF